MQVLSTGLVYIFARLLSLIHCPGGSASASSDQSTPKSVRKERAKQAAYQQAEQQQCWRPCSKHTLLQALCDQFQHINDVAALIHHSAATENYIGWRCELAALGLNPAVGCYSAFSLKWLMEHCIVISLERLLDNIKQAFLIGCNGFLDFFGRKGDLHNVWKEFIAFDFPEGHDLQFHDQLAFVCSLYRLQQLPSQAVLARFHSLLSRSCRCDLLLLLQVLQLHTRNIPCREAYFASRQETPAADVLTAFGQAEPAIKDVMASLTPTQRRIMRLCVKDMVDSFVAPKTLWTRRMLRHVVSKVQHCSLQEL